jgi:hypothetical protein
MNGYKSTWTAVDALSNARLRICSTFFMNHKQGHLTFEVGTSPNRKAGKYPSIAVDHVSSPKMQYPFRPPA